MKTITNPREQEAYVKGLEARSEAMRLMGTPEYRAGDPAVHARVRLHFLNAYGGEPVRTHVVSAGQAPAGPGSRPQD